MDIEGHIACIVGGASGLGAATAGAFARRGARVCILDRQPPQDASTAFFEADVAEAESVSAVFDAMAQDIGVPRVVINCAGIAPAARVVGRDGVASTELFARVIGVNLIGTFNVMAHAVRVMKALQPLGVDQARGVIVNTASVAYEEGQIGQTAYAASKGGVASMTLPAARELARDGIRVMAIAPGLFQTPMMEGLPKEVTETIASGIPYPTRLGAPAEFAELAAHIVENDYLNGTVIRLDGATRLPPR
ncbi:MAG: SDR family NAD(P)-dependent oxidoreductase [Shimia sp.]